MAYRRKTTSKKYGGRPKARRGSNTRRKTTKRRSAPKRAKRASGSQRITLVIQQAPATPTLATPAAKAAPVRAKFGG